MTAHSEKYETTANIPHIPVIMFLANGKQKHFKFFIPFLLQPSVTTS